MILHSPYVVSSDSVIRKHSLTVLYSSYRPTVAAAAAAAALDTGNGVADDNPISSSAPICCPIFIARQQDGT